MELITISNEQFDYFYSLLEKDFPYVERKDESDELNAFHNPMFKPNFILKDGNIIGYFCYWDFSEFIFGEHFAILEQLRNSGLGTQFLKEYLPKSTKPLIIEVERPNTVIAKRRINFYKRLGFVVNDFNYVQPSYHGETDGVPMYIVSYKTKISQSNYDKYISLIRKEVYRIN